MFLSRHILFIVWNMCGNYADYRIILQITFCKLKEDFFTHRSHFSGVFHKHMIRILISDKFAVNSAFLQLFIKLNRV